jgi:xanthine dehydrogenase accessory factor
MFENKEYLKFIQNSKKQGLDLVGVSVVQTLGSTYAKAGNLMLINSNFEFVGVFGSKHLHNQILEYTKTAFENKKSLYFENVPKDESSGHGSSKYFLQAYFFKDDYGILGESLKSFDKTLIRDITNNKITLFSFDFWFRCSCYIPCKYGKSYGLENYSYGYKY